MNPRVSRSSALASKATGFPIAKIATRLAIGYTLDEIPQRHHRPDPGLVRARARLRRGQDPAVRVREVPRRRPHADHPHEVRRRGDGDRPHASPRPCRRRSAAWRARPAPLPVRPARGATPPSCWSAAASPHDGRLGTMLQALRAGATAAGGGRGHRCRPVVRGAARLHQDPLPNDRGFAPSSTVTWSGWPRRRASPTPPSPSSAAAGPSLSAGAAPRAGGPARLPRGRHLRGGVRRPHAVPLLHLRRGRRGAAGATPRRCIILGSGPNRIGQGIEFDYSCVHASLALRAAGYETVMVNCNPETVSTDYDTSSRLYFEPLTLEDVLEVVRGRAARRAGGRGDRAARRPDTARAGPRPGRRGRPGRRHLARRHPRGRGPGRVRRGAGRGRADRAAVARSPRRRRGRGRGRRDRLPGPGPAVLRARRARHGDRLRRGHAARLRRPRHRGQPGQPGADRPVPGRRHRDRRGRACTTAQELYLGGVMEHIEEAGIHSGDSACALPPITLGGRTSTRSGKRRARLPAAWACAAC